MLIAWLPALLVLGGRMYVRPETLSLLYLSIYLAVLFRIDRLPALAFVLPVVQVAWVNTQGLFVLGPIVLALRPDRRRAPARLVREGAAPLVAEGRAGDLPDRGRLPGQSLWALGCALSRSSWPGR